MTERVLVVDDDAPNAQYVRDLLADWGFEPAFAYSAEHALAVAKQRSVDAVITDLRMPDIDGFALIRKLRAMDPTVAVIAVTAFGSAESGTRALEAGAAVYLTKPFQPDVLGERLRQVLGRRALRIKNERLRRDVDAHLKDNDPRRR